MTQVAATEFIRNFGHYRELAQRAPVAVTSHDRVTGYYLAAHEFEAYQQLKARASVAVAAGEFDDELVAALSTTRMDDRHTPLDALMD